MYERSFGTKYDKTKSTKTIAAEVRAEIRAAARFGVLPEGKWSVTSDRYAGGSSITIAFAPLPENDEAFAMAYYNRRRIEHDAATPNVYTAIPYRSAFGTELVRRLEELLAAHNHDGSEIQVDYFDVKFYGNVTIRTRTEEKDLVELLRGGCWPAERTLADIDPKLGALMSGWEQAEAEAAAAVEVAAQTAAWEAALPLAPSAHPHLRLVKPEPVEQLLTANVEARGGTGVVEALRPPRPGARRRPIAVLVEEPVPQAPNEAWLRLVVAQGLDLDWAIPGLGGLVLDFEIPGLAALR